MHSSLAQSFSRPQEKCGIFGVSCEATSNQINYLINESDDVGKGANATISLVHHYLQNHSLKEKHLLHADNCVGQNKNNMVVQYLAWRVIAGLSETIELSFMLVGHTKFAPDRLSVSTDNRWWIQWQILYMLCKNHQPQGKTKPNQGFF